MFRPGIPCQLACALVGILAAAIGPAHAAGCAKPEGRLLRVICADKGVRAAEERMSRTYFGALARAPDKEAHDLLQSAQRRWVAAREEAWGSGSASEEPDGWDDGELSMLLLHDTRDRAAWIEGFYDRLARERAVSGAFTGGPFAGASVSCGRAPKGFGNGYHFCTGYLSMQHGDRVCTREVGWASGHALSARSVQKVTAGGLVGVASCTDGYASGRRCPGSGGTASEEGWSADSGLSDRAASGQAPGGAPRELPRFALDLGAFAGEAGWMRECLTARDFPDPGLIRQAGESNAR